MYDFINQLWIVYIEACPIFEDSHFLGLIEMAMAQENRFSHVTVTKLLWFKTKLEYKQLTFKFRSDR